MNGILLLGGHSDIGGDLLTRLCAGRPVVLAARRAWTLTEVAERATAAGATEVHTLDFEATDLASHRALVDRAADLTGGLGTAIVAFGILGEQRRAETDEAHAVEIATVDYTAQVSMLTILADTMTRGEIIAFSSIAGWRARRANYVYGSTKAGLDAFCQGLADRLHGTPLRLITARPGFVIGSMTEGMDPAPMSVTPAEVADAVATEITDGKGSTTLWIPRRLRLLAWIMAAVPRPIWRKMPR
ncbi:SDR family oxidoreductase [Corynebacterium suedekumii]|uniref:SDR family oxidoreductase n=1 Tax=Corynebacterium suedekumii TaxID=3049801 RepID=A0ABY8VM43_9CORY|nr:SDR family oxidoreductase [Corynebacterium suedekumii]WIM69728.1 SDR family oxidoreductase [Corynebacterium suedekumii]